MRIMPATSLIILLCVPEAIAEPGWTVGDAALHHAPGPYGTGGRTLESGTEVEVGVCFDEGAYCYVEAANATGYVEGSLLEVAAGRVDEVERARWERLRRARLKPGKSQMIAAWGDSLHRRRHRPAGDRYLIQAERLFGFARAIDNNGVGGQDSTAIAAPDERSADPAAAGRLRLHPRRRPGLRDRTQRHTDHQPGTPIARRNPLRRYRIAGGGNS